MQWTVLSCHSCMYYGCFSVNMVRKCLNLPNLFCYFCSEFTTKSGCKSLDPAVKEAYELYLDVTLETKRRDGHQVYVAADVHVTFKAS